MKWSEGLGQKHCGRRGREERKVVLLPYCVLMETIERLDTWMDNQRSGAWGGKTRKWGFLYSKGEAKTGVGLRKGGGNRGQGEKGRANCEKPFMSS